MNKLFLATALTLMSLSFADAAFAAPSNAKNLYELCVLEEEESEISKSFDVVQSIDIKQTQSISEFLLKLVNVHLIEEQYTEKSLSFQEVKKLFSNDGEQGYNDLYITAFGSKKTGNLYVEVKSYPGDNPYALIFNAYEGKVVAKIQDGSVMLVTNKGARYCGN